MEPKLGGPSREPCPWGGSLLGWNRLIVRKTTEFSSFVAAVSLYTYMQEILLSPHLGNSSCNDCAMLLHRSANFPAIISARVMDLLQAG